MKSDRQQHRYLSLRQALQDHDVEALVEGTAVPVFRHWCPPPWLRRGERVCLKLHRTRLDPCRNGVPPFAHKARLCWSDASNAKGEW